jgi:uncharacterized membrane protein YcjF (UPF0283 family)
MKSSFLNKPVLQLLNKRIAFHCYFWAVVFPGIFILVIKLGKTAGYSLQVASLYSVLLAIPVYLHFFVLETFFNRKKYTVYILTAAGILVAAGNLNHYLMNTLFSPKNTLLAYHVHVLIFIVFTTALKFLKTDFRQRLRRQENETRQLEEELKQLKSKISADVILDELTELHTLSKDKPGKVPELILKHSESMRRLLKKPGVQPVELIEKKEERRKMPGIFFSRLAWYIYFWILLFILVFFPWSTTEPFIIDKFNTFYFFFFLSLPTYPHFFLLDRFFRKKFFTYLLLTAGTITFSAAVYNYIFSNYLDYDATILKWVLELTFAVIITAAIRIVKNGFKQRIQLQEIKSKHLQSELILLKSQVNPHFFFNTLNNLYSLSLDQSEKLPGLIRKLRDLMAYMLKSSQAETVPLMEEWHFLENYLSLEKLRLSEESNIKTTVKGELKGRRVAPMLLIPFVENSFKHGVSTTAGDFFVHIQLKVEADHLFFSVANNRLQAFAPSRESSPKPGLKNVKRRLDLLYPNRHNLDIHETGKTFKIELEIWL